MDFAFVVLLGLLLGSFATAMIYRIPREIPLGLFSHQRSFCPQCDTKIPWHYNLPLLAFALHRGKGVCGHRIPWRYPLVEFLMALSFGGVYAVYTQYESRPFEDWAFYLDLGKHLFFFWSLIVVFFIDLDFRIIPDRFSWGNWALALFFVFLLGEPPLLEGVAGGLLGFSLFYFLAWFYEKWKGIEGLGFGDVKMMGWLGTWLGLEAVAPLILIASLSGIAVGLVAMRRSGDGMKTAIPFGPFLAIGAAIMWFWRYLGFSPPLG